MTITHHLGCYNLIFAVRFTVRHDSELQWKTAVLVQWYSCPQYDTLYKTGPKKNPKNYSKLTFKNFNEFLKIYSNMVWAAETKVQHDAQIFSSFSPIVKLKQIWKKKVWAKTKSRSFKRGSWAECWIEGFWIDKTGRICLLDTMQTTCPLQSESRKPRPRRWR